MYLFPDDFELQTFLQRTVTQINLGNDDFLMYLDDGNSLLCRYIVEFETSHGKRKTCFNKHWLDSSNLHQIPGSQLTNVYCESTSQLVISLDIGAKLIFHTEESLHECILISLPGNHLLLF
ncbi:MAG: hypothetical protein ACRBHB_22050 [Arenicella sp.]